MNNTLTRLPCRGCVRSCKHYASCHGRPWRLPVENSAPNKTHSDKAKAMVAQIKLS